MDNIPRLELILLSLTLSLVVTGYMFSDSRFTGSENEKDISEVDFEVDEETQTVLIVMDGGDWVPIEQLIRQGELPNFSRMMDKGVYGDLITPSGMQHLSWTRMSTGVEDVNVSSWTVREDGESRMTNSGDVENKRIWDYLGRVGIDSGVTNFFLTWPVEPINGYMVSESMAQGNYDLQYPEGFIDEEVLQEGSEFEIANETLKSDKDVSFKAYGFKALDAKQHALWRFIVPEEFGNERQEEHKKYRDEVYDEYRKIDDFVGQFGDEWNIFVVSSFGFTEEGNYRAESLEQFHAGDAPSGYSYPTYEADMDPILRELGYLDYSVEIQDNEEVKQIHESQAVNCPVDFPNPTYLNETAFIFNICIKDSDLNPSELKNSLEKITYDDGRDFFEGVTYDEERNQIEGIVRYYEDAVVEERIEPSYTHQPFASFEGYEVDKAIDLNMPGNQDYRYWIGPEKSGTHRQATSGIFLAKGPDIDNSGKIPEGNIAVEDIAPTIMYLYNLPVPEEMDGRPVTGIFTDELNRKRDMRLTDASVRKGEKYLGRNLIVNDSDEVFNGVSQLNKDLNFSVKDSLTRSGIQLTDRSRYSVSSSTDWGIGKIQSGKTNTGADSLSLADDSLVMDYWESPSLRLNLSEFVFRVNIPDPENSNIEAKVIYSSNPEFENAEGDYYRLGTEEFDVSSGINHVNLDNSFENSEEVYYRVFFSMERENSEVESPKVDAFKISGEKFDGETLIHNSYS